MILLKIKRSLSLLSKLVSEFRSLARYYQFSYAYYNLLWWLCFYFRTPLSFRLSTYAIKKKALWLDEYIERHYADIIRRFSQQEEESSPIETYPIWVFWGQGEREMPILVKACYHQLKRNNPNVHLVTIDNLSEYIDIPDTIRNKVSEGRITWAHFSDIIRMTLLAKHGGLWMDATVWTPGALPMAQLRTMSLFTANGINHYTGRSIRFWTSFQWNWSGWCIGTNIQHHQLFSFVSEMLIRMGQKENHLIDYVLIDYLIYYACRKFPAVSRDMNEAKTMPCIHRNDLASWMPKAYQEEIYHQLTATDFVFKLSFRTPWATTTADGKQTFYGRLIAQHN